MAVARREDGYELVAAYAYRDLGNYFAGAKGYDKWSVQNNWMNGGGDNDKQEVGVVGIFKPGEEVLNTASTTRSALLKGTLQLGETQALELGYRYFHSRHGEIMASQIVRNDGDRIAQWPHSTVQVDAYSARYQWQPQDNPLLKLKANLWLTDMDSDAMNGDVFRTPWQGKPAPGWSDDDPVAVSARYRAHVQNQRRGADISNSSRLNGRLGALKLDYGLSWQHEDIAPGKSVVRDQADIDHNRTLRDGSRRVHSVFFGGSWAPNAVLSLELGGRYTRFASHDRNVRATRHDVTRAYRTVDVYAGSGNDEERIGYLKWYPDANGQYQAADDPSKQAGSLLYGWNTDPVPFDPATASRLEVDEQNEYADVISSHYRYSTPFVRRDGGFAPALGINLKLSDSVTAYARYREGLRMPSLMESTLGSSTPFLRPLAPERSQNVELGASLLRDGWLHGSDKLRAKLAYFDNKTKGYITRRPIPTQNAWDQNFTMANMDKYTVQGWELQAAYDSGHLFGDLSATYNQRVTVCDRATAAYFQARIDAAYLSHGPVPECSPTGFSTAYVRNHVPPKLNVSLVLGSRWLNQALTVGSRVVYNSAPAAAQAASGRPWESWDGTANQVLTRAYTLVDLFASYRLSRDASLDMAVDNVGNRYHLDPLTLSLMPGPGRTYRLALAAKF